jgi:hypothetical protein
MAVSVALVPVFIAVIGLVGVPFFRRVYRFDWATSWYAAMPGGLTDMVIFGAGGGRRRARAQPDPRDARPDHRDAGAADPDARLRRHARQPIGAPASELPLHEMLIMAAAAIIGWKLGERVGLFGAPILGPMILTGALSLLDVIHYRPPGRGDPRGAVPDRPRHRHRLCRRHAARDPARRDGGRDLRRDPRDPGRALHRDRGDRGPCAAGRRVPRLRTGGQAEMTVLAIIVGADLGYIIVHHLTRVLLVITGAPLVARWSMRLDRRQAGRPTKRTRGPAMTFTTRPELLGTFGMVSTTHWLASQAGMKMLEAGGTAADAAVAAGFVLNVVEPHLNGPLGRGSRPLLPAGADTPLVLCGQGTARRGDGGALPVRGARHHPGLGPSGGGQRPGPSTPGC